MGHSPSIADLEKKEDAFRQYLQKLESELEQEAQKSNDAFQKTIDDYYTHNQWKPVKFISGTNVDFMQASEWSLDNLKKIIDAIAKAVFGDGGALPKGVKVENADEISKSFGEMENWELYIAGKAFEVLAGIMESFGSLSTVSMSHQTSDQALGNGLHLFASVTAHSYKSHSFFSNEEIYEYFYMYEVFYSVGEAQQQANMELTKLYEDQIVVYTNIEEGLLQSLEDNSLTPAQYASLKKSFDELIQATQKQLASLKATAKAHASR